MKIPRVDFPTSVFLRMVSVVAFGDNMVLHKKKKNCSGDIK